MEPAEYRRRKPLTDEEKRAFWKEQKKNKKMRRRLANEAKKKENQSEWDNLPDDEKERKRLEAVACHERRRKEEAELADRCQRQLQDSSVPRLVFDLSFAWCMSAGDTKSTVAQIKFSYSALRRAGFPMSPVITSLVGKDPVGEPKEGELISDAERRELLSQLQVFEGFKRFSFPIHDEHWSTLFPLDRVVFLTADAEEVLETIESNYVYIVGAFVDHNQHKRLTLDAAERLGVRTARLPIKENIDVSNRCQILTVNHVVELLSYFLTSGSDWKTSLEACLPVRRVHQQMLGSRRKRSRGGADEESLPEHSA